MTLWLSRKAKWRQAVSFSGIRVLLLDGYGRQIEALLLELHSLRCNVTTVCNSKLDIGYLSKYPKKKIVIKGVKDNVNKYIEWLVSNLNPDNFDVVIPVLEPSTNLLLSNECYSNSGVKIAAAPYKAFELAYNKQSTMEICMDNGVPCPTTRRENETIDEYLSKTDFPIAIKPRRGTGSIGFKKVNSNFELNELINSGIVNPNEYIIQKFIRQSGLQYGSYIYMDDNSEPKLFIVVEKNRWFPIDGGPGCLIRTVVRPDIEQYSYDLLKQMKWKGFAHIGFIEDPDDNNIPKVMEINGRLPASIRLCSLCGFNVSELMLERAFGYSITDYGSNQIEDIRMRYSQTDFLWFIKSRNRFKTTPSWFSQKNTTDYIFTIRDPLPYFGYTIASALRSKTEMQKRKH